MKILSEYSLGDMSVRYVLGRRRPGGHGAVSGVYEAVHKRGQAAIRLIRWCSGRKRETPFPMALPTV